MGEKEGQKDLSATLGHPEVTNTHGNMDREDFGQYNHRKKDLSVTLGQPEISKNRQDEKTGREGGQQGKGAANIWT